MPSPVSLMQCARPKLVAALLAAAALSGCASLLQPPVQPGEPEEQVVARLGAPTNVYPDGNGRVFEYAAGAFGQYQYMARIGPDHRLISYERSRQENPLLLSSRKVTYMPLCKSTYS